MSLQVFGIPNCGSCKKAKQWLDNNKIDYEFIDLKESTPSQEQIKDWVNALGFKPMRNTSGKSYRSLGAQRNDWNQEQWIEHFSQDAMLLKRPLFIKDGKAVLVGFRASESELQAKLSV